MILCEFNLCLFYIADGKTKDSEVLVSKPEFILLLISSRMEF
jgi:hypothetical protein